MLDKTKLRYGADVLQRQRRLGGDEHLNTRRRFFAALSHISDGMGHVTKLCTVMEGRTESLVSLYRLQPAVNKLIQRAQPICMKAPVTVIKFEHRHVALCTR